MSKQIQYKTFDFEMKQLDEDAKEAVFTGYASTFGNVDQGLDVVKKGAFKKTLKDSGGKVPILADHDPRTQIGWNETAIEDSKGLLVEGSLDLNVQKAVERYSLAKKAMKIGAPMGLSIGYMTIQAEPDSKNPNIRILKELKLFEYSFVTFPMNTEAMLTAAKSIGSIDKAKFLIQHLKDEGITLKDLEIALRNEAAQVDYDPTKVSQSIDNLITKFRG